MATAAERAKEREAAILKRQKGKRAKTPAFLEEIEELAPDPQDVGIDPDPQDVGIDPDPQDVGIDPDPQADGNLSEIEQLRAELAKQRADYEALHGRLSPAQQDLEHYRAEARKLQQELAAREEARQKEIEELRQQLEAKHDPLDIDDILTAEEKAEFDPTLIKTIAKMADAIAQRRTSRINAKAAALEALEERERQRVEAYRRRVMSDPGKGLHTLASLANDPRFVAWTREDDNDMDSVLNSLLSARSVEDIDRYARIASRRIASYRSQNGKAANRSDSKPATSRADATARLRTGMRRGSDTRGSEREREEQLEQAKHLARSHRAEDRAKAKAILDNL